MTQSMISFVVGLAVVLAIVVMLVQRYLRDHKSEGMVQWLDAHHMSWMHHKH
ncbi:hypothetical protein [Burkholderia stabilis]|uniref:Uncharacterized protein n=1 Tax=Burkholderia stabilis TaxID=95485 RepID=A0AAJ5T7L7_9BURK|nr:hypothetical protein [Burkholderia stabilis]VBB15497.1 hypothetical protein BSTAB16_5693 [Burkholderia stabilis]HDR9490214.1 hypothetical protein [Burkholderia stabilis]HDR9521301.1 hypothetical protein [Burkholderia stabilis]HDR9529883.1 hypothetical protein [Burkholderia stabilis]HDR9537319.1 hypothetical protein [Burkholderia stabilis]